MLKTKLNSSLVVFVLALLLGCSPADREPTAAPAVEEQEIAPRTAAVAMPDKYGAVVAEQILQSRRATLLTQALPPGWRLP